MTLYENFNTSRQTSPWLQRHENFVSELSSPGCAIVQTHIYEDRCEFVKGCDDCHEDMQMLDYTDLFYCQLDPRSGLAEIFGILCLFVGCFYFSAFIGTITDIFFCPALKVITKELGISENLAGITLLAFGTSAPDLISDLTGVERGDVGTQYSDSMGAALFINSCIAGAVIYMKPMEVEPATFTRDVSFLILAILFIDYAIKNDGYVSIPESCGMMGVYALYFVLIITDQIILVRTLNKLKKTVNKQEAVTDAQTARLQKLQEEAGFEITIKAKGPINIDPTKKTEFTASNRIDLMIAQLIESLMPFEWDDWDEGGWFDKLCIILQIPINLIIFACLPAVDFDLEMNGWSKILNCLQIILLPTSMAIILASDLVLFGYQFPVLVAMAMSPFCVLAFLLTRVENEPTFHVFFAAATIIGSIVAIRIFSMEVVNIINVLGYVTYRSTSFLGCTVLAWGNNVGDLVASIEFAQQGYQKMGLASCIAGPLFYLTLGMGCTYLIKAYSEEISLYKATQGAMGDNCTIFLMANLTFMLLGASMTNFMFRKSIGSFLCIIYGLFCFWCLMSEYYYIHGYGTDHSEDYGVYFM